MSVEFPGFSGRSSSFGALELASKIVLTKLHETTRHTKAALGLMRFQNANNPERLDCPFPLQTSRKIGPNVLSRKHDDM